MKIWGRLFGAALFGAGAEGTVDVYKGVRYAEKAQRWKAPVPYQGTFEHALENRKRVQVVILAYDFGKNISKFLAYDFLKIFRNSWHNISGQVIVE